MTKKKEKASLRLIAWNVQNFNKDTAENSLAAMACVINRSDITVLTEVDKDAATGIINTILSGSHESVPIITEICKNPYLGERVVFYYNKNKLNLKSSGRFEHVDNLRKPAFIGVVEKSTGWPFVCIGVHLKAKEGTNIGVIKQEAERLFEATSAVNDLLKKDVDSIILGDFNIDPKDFKLEAKTKTGKETMVALINEPTMVDAKKLSINDNIAVLPFYNDSIVIKESCYAIKNRDLNTTTDGDIKGKKQKLEEGALSDKESAVIAQITLTSDHWPVAARMDFIAYNKKLSDEGKWNEFIKNKEVKDVQWKNLKTTNSTFGGTTIFF